MSEPEHRLDPATYWEGRLERCDLGAVGYSALGTPYNRWLYRVRAAVFRRLVRRIPLDWASAHVLDIGSGTGFYVAEWIRIGVPRVVASDLTSASTDRLRLSFPAVDVEQWDVASAPPFPPESFDAISAFDVLFHVIDDDRYRSALANIAALVREGGYFIFSENFVHGPEVRVRHQVSRPLEEIEALLEDVGFEVLGRRPMFVIMNAPIDSTNAVRWRIWNLVRRLVVGHSRRSGLVGASLFPLELVLTSIAREGPSTEVMVCRKRPAVSLAG